MPSLLPLSLVKTGLMKTLFFVLFFFTTLHAEEGNPTAEKVAFESASVKAAVEDIAKMIANIRTDKDLSETLKNASASLLNTKGSNTFKFTVLSRQWNEQEIVKELNSRLDSYMDGKPVIELSEYNTEKNPLFPKNVPMSFIAAPGSASGGHHVYPGGLVHHTYANILSATRLAETYEKTYQVKISQTEKNLAMLAALWHDAAKPWVLKWNEDGTLTNKEGKIAGTSAHHIWILSELAMREISPDFIVAVAGAHDAVIEGQPSEKKVIGYLLAASLISGKSLAQVGLEQKQGMKLIILPRLSHYLNNLGDADWAISVPAQKKALELVGASKVTNATERWKMLSQLSKHGEIPLYNAWRTGGDSAVNALLK